MNIYFFSNVGTSDLQAAGKTEGEWLHLDNQREKASDILQLLDSLSSDEWLQVDQMYSLPILGPTIDHIYSQVCQPIDEVLLFVTDQDPRVTPHRFYQKDTIITGHVIKTILTKHPKYKDKIKAIRLIPIHAKSSDYDAVYMEFSRHFRYLAKEITWPSHAQLFALLTGGTPQCNLALMYHFLFADGLSGNRFALYKNPEAPPEYLDIPRSVRYEHLYNVCLKLLARHDYDGIKDLVMYCGLPQNKTEALTNLVTGASLRYNFRFEDAKVCFYKLLRSGYSGRFQGAVNQFYNQTDKLAQGITSYNEHRLEPSLPPSLEIRMLFEELFSNLESKYNNDEGVDFLGRLFRLQETLLQFGASLCYPPFITTKSPWIHQELAAKDPRFKEYLEKQLGPYVLSRTINRPILYYTIRFHLKHGKRDKLPIATLRSICSWAENIGITKPKEQPVNVGLAQPSNLMELRNQSIIGHGFYGFSRKDIHEMHGEELLTDTKTLLEEIIGQPVNNPYESQDKFISQQLEAAFKT